MKKEIKISINRAEFELNLDKADKVREILRQLYNTDEPNERYITKSLEFLEKEEVNRRFSINDLIVHKDEEEIHFLLKKHRPIFWLLLVLWLLLLIAELYYSEFLKEHVAMITIAMDLIVTGIFSFQE